MITQGYLARHYMGRTGMAGPALLDVAQDYALQYLSGEGIFDLGVVLTGGTSLRKFRAGNAGRFSTDLDFAAPGADTGEPAFLAPAWPKRHCSTRWLRWLGRCRRGAGWRSWICWPKASVPSTR